MPRRWIFLDTEAREEERDGTKHQSWRLAVTAFDHNDTRSREWAPTLWETHKTPGQLWGWVDARCVTKARTCVVAHNIAYDLRIADAFTYLPQLDWRLHSIALHERSMSATFRRGTRTLCLVDSMAWLPTALNNVAGLVHIEKPPLPMQGALFDEWEHRCRSDVEILRAAWLHLLQWIREDDLGNWQRTGAAMAWANWRHKHYTHRVLVHDCEEAQSAEAQSTYTGRCEAWRWGKLGAGLWTEWDLPLAYPRIALDVDVPVHLIGTRTKPPLRFVTDKGKGRRVLAYAQVSTEQPTLPVKTAKGIAWPVGSFEGWYWDTELANAIEHGAEVTVPHCFVYRGRPALAAWARWIIDTVETPGESVSALRQLAAKHWARALIGRFATQYTEWQPYGPAFAPGVGTEVMVNYQTSERGELLTLGADAFVGWSKRYGADACPAINAVVVAEARVRLWRLMRAAGLENVAYVDTDSLITNEAGTQALDALTASGGGWELRRKSEGRGLTILGPRQLIIGTVPRVSGMPRNAERIGRQHWAGEAWEGIGAAFARGVTDEVVIRRAGFRLAGVDNRRAHLPKGLTEPLRIDGASLAAVASEGRPRAARSA